MEMELKEKQQYKDVQDHKDKLLAKLNHQGLWTLRTPASDAGVF